MWVQGLGGGSVFYGDRVCAWGEDDVLGVCVWGENDVLGWTG